MITPESQFIVKIFKSVKKNVKETKQILPAFFIGKGDEIQIIATPFTDDESKNQAAEFVRKQAKSMHAEFVLFVVESFMLTDQMAVHEYMGDKAKYNYCMGNHPKAQDIVMFILETETKEYSGIACISENRELGEIKWDSSGELGGRFAKMLGTKPTVN